MKQNKMKTLAELTDSEILYCKKIPPFGFFTILTVFLLLISLIVWSLKASKIEIVKSGGVVQSINKNYVMAPYSGEIIEINITEGQYVQAGEVLFIIKSIDIDLQMTQLEEEKKTYETQVSQNEKLIRSIKDDTNYFSPTDPDDSFYYNQFEAYKSQVSQYDVSINAMQGWGYTEQQIEEELKKNQAKLLELYYSALQSAENAKQQAQAQLDSIHAQLAALEQGKEGYQVVAMVAGQIHMLGEYKVGMLLQAAGAIASIASAQDEYIVKANVNAQDAARIHLADTVDIAVAGLPQAVYGTLTGKVTKIDSDVTMPQAGSENVSEPYFKVEITLDYAYLVAKTGGNINLSNGMLVETRIQYDKMTYFDYFLESLGLLTK